MSKIRVKILIEQLEKLLILINRQEILTLAHFTQGLTEDTMSIKDY